MTTEKKIGTCLGMPANGLELNAQSQDRKTKKMNTTKKNAIVHPIYSNMSSIYPYYDSVERRRRCHDKASVCLALISNYA